MGIGGVDTGSTLPVDADALAHAGRRYREQQHVVVPKFVTPAQTAAMLEETRSLPKRRVSCGTEAIAWAEQRIPPTSRLFALFCSRHVFDWIEACTGRRRAECRRIAAWTSVYAAGEYINPHQDSSGELHAILSLKNPGRELGGWIGLKAAGKSELVFLEPGDLLLFPAAEVQHYSTPLTRTAEQPHPSRIVAVFRYFFC